MHHVKKMPDQWRFPSLDPEGQRRFWDNQAGTYEFADMTNDNKGEQFLVEDLSDEFVALGHGVADVVTLGGAVGCRDPRIVVERLAVRGVSPGKIHFNDLSPALVERASANALSQYRTRGIIVTTSPGRIVDVAQWLPKLPRRVLIGVYSADAFTTSAPDEAYPQDGLSEYLANRPTLGDRFFLEWFRLDRGEYTSLDEVRISVGRPTDEAPCIARESLVATGTRSEVLKLGALRVVGVHEKEENGFFLSHWFTQRGFKSLLHEAFGDRAAHMRIFPCAKGMVACLDPVGAKPKGILTVLNNVIGNVLPDEQLPSLRAIHELTA